MAVSCYAPRVRVVERVMPAVDPVTVTVEVPGGVPETLPASKSLPQPTVISTSISEKKARIETFFRPFLRTPANTMPINPIPEKPIQFA